MGRMATLSDSGDSLVLRLEGFEGPMDLLLDLARRQKVDLAKISIAALADQYLAVIEGAALTHLERAADWLVMAAWLTWLKSRLLAPSPPDELGDGEAMAEALAERLRAMHLARALAGWLAARPVLGWDAFARGAPESHKAFDRSRVILAHGPFVQAYLTAARRSARPVSYSPRPLPLWSVQDALGRIGGQVGNLPDWTTLQSFLPDLPVPADRRAAWANTLLASLEMARGGRLRLRQDEAFGPILLRQGRNNGGSAG